MVGLMAKINSLTLPSFTFSTKDVIFRSCGPMPSIGDILPPKTW